ncbi:MAG: DNA polymerase IV [Bacilli bacterium]|nr:DNA polymerase IV [Bacilli bacterium]
MKERIIFHIDVNNAFLSWTAVALLKKGYKIDIRTIPSIIAGDEQKRQGIVLAKSPIAKKYGIKTAETIYQAKKKCPNIQIFSPDFKIYYEQSKNLFNYLKQYSPLIEQFSIDECFLDMTGTNYLYKDYLKLADKIRTEIYNLFGFTVNIGIGNNKLCAKMASDFEKPNKVHTLYKNEIEQKLWPLDVEDLFMCGKKSKIILNNLNIYTIKDLAYFDSKNLEKYFKNQAKYLKEAAWGIDYSKVETTKTSKNQSISISETLPFDMLDKEKIKEVLFRQIQEITRELRQKKLFARTIAIIYKNKNFVSYTAQTKLNNPSDNTSEIFKVLIKLFEKSFKNEPIRLIGIRLTDLQKTKEKQISIFDTNLEEKENSKIEKTMDKINNKFGKSLVAPASLKIIGISNSKNKYKK